MKKLSFLMISIIVSNIALGTNYRVVIEKEDVGTRYEVKPGSLIPKSDIQTTIINNKSLETDSGDLLTDSLSISAESGDSIYINTNISDVENDGRLLDGSWSANTAINFTNNSKSYASFLTPEYDGTIVLNLNLTDGVNEKNTKAISILAEHWTETTPIYGDWQTISVSQDWSPSASSYYENETVTQSRILDRERTVQDREIRPSTGVIRNVGDEYIESESSATETQDVQGALEYWELTDPEVVTDWTVTEVFQDWTPDASTVYETESVNQSREVKKERTIQKREIRPATGVIRNTGGVVSDTTLTTEYQTVQGALEYWENTGESSCTEWTFDRYEDWLPDASNYARDVTVAQTRMGYDSRECSGEQYRPATDETRLATAEVEYRSYEETRTVNGTLINLNDWSTTDSSTYGDWSVSSDGSYVYQSINGQPTIFESSADNFASTTITGKIRVRAGAGDNDWVGMVMGMTNSNNFYLWSWKNGSNSGSAEKEGHNFAKVTSRSAIGWDMDVSKTGYSVLATKHGNYGWNHGNYYNFKIIYTPTNVKIYINDSLVINKNGTYPSGKIGFFNYSQGQVEYYKVSDTPM